MKGLLRTAACCAVAALIISCEGNILSGPEQAARVTLTAAPTVTVAVDTLTIRFTTSISSSARVDYGTATGTYSTFVSEPVATATEHTVILSALEAGTTYYYRVVSALDDSRSFNSAEYSAKTSDAVTLTATPTVTSALTSLTIGFTTNQAATTEIRYGTTSGTYTAVAAVSATAAINHSVVISGLSTGTVYYYVVKSTLDGKTYTSSEYTATTTAEDPSAAKKARGIWLLGGLSGNSFGATVAAVDLYDPVTDSWYGALTSVPVPVSFAAYAAYGGKLYVIGGFDTSGILRDLVQIYDTASGTWSNGEAMIYPRANITAAVCSGKIYILGGSTGVNATAGWVGSTTTQEYNMAGNTWTVSALTAFGTAGTERFSYAYNNVVYNFGGRTTFNGLVTTHDGYVPSFNLLLSTSTEVVLPAARAGLSGAVYAPSNNDAFVMMIGGASALSAPNSFVRDGVVSATLTNTVYCLAAPFMTPSVWRTATTPYPDTIAFGSAVVSTAMSPARIYQFGGINTFSTSTIGLDNCNWSAVPDSTAAWATAWTSVTMPRGRWGHGAVTFNQ